MIFESPKGVNFYGAVEECQKEIRKTGRKYMTLVFNEIHVTVNYDSNPDDLATIYDLKSKLVRNGLSY